MLIFNRLYEFLETFDSLYNLQFGFRSKHLTTHAEMHWIEKWLFVVYCRSTEAL